MMTTHGNRLVMAQQFIPEIKQGDKRIILINGEPAAPLRLHAFLQPAIFAVI